MKTKFLISIMCTCLLVSCFDLDLNPLSSASNENWNQTEVQLEQSINNFYAVDHWVEVHDCWNDDQIDRNSAGDFAAGRITSESSETQKMWDACYRAIARVNAVLKKMEQLPAGTLSEEKKNQFLGECYFMRACMYSRLIFHYGDVPYSDTVLDIETALAMGRIPKAEVLQHIYDDFDAAVELLPVSCSGQTRATKGAAAGMKARVALWMEDWDTVIASTGYIINELKCYELYEDYNELFLNKTHNTKESVFSVGRSVAAGVTLTGWGDRTPRNNGGYARYVPSWGLLAAYLCTDGKPIDESRVFDSHEPFKNRDPRCCATIVPFGELFMGFVYDPKVTEEAKNDKKAYTTNAAGEKVENKDNIATTDVASYSGLLWKKKVSEDCIANGFKTEHDMWILRYADILLMYVEAKIEKNDIDQSVRDAMNQVRARAYKCDYTETDKYPAVRETDQSRLRTLLRIERRMEFPNEGLRYYDIIRWKLCEKLFGEGKKSYGLHRSGSGIYDNLVKTEYWFWGMTPPIDEDGIADFSLLAEKDMEGKTMCTSLCTYSFSKRQYLWPIPTKEIIINPNMKQNEGY